MYCLPTTRYKICPCAAIEANSRVPYTSAIVAILRRANIAFFSTKAKLSCAARISKD